MGFISFEFLLFVLVAMPLLRFTTNLRLKHILLFLLNAAFFCSFFGSIAATFPVLGVLILGVTSHEVVHSN